VRRLLPASLLTLAIMLALAAPAFAHPSFDVTQVGSGATESYSLHVPIEREAGHRLIEVLLPSGWTVVSCDAANDWACEWDNEMELDGASQVKVSLMQLAGAAVTTDRFAMELTAPTEIGIYRFPVAQEHDDGAEVAWLEEPGSDHPAPRIQEYGRNAAASRPQLRRMPSHRRGRMDPPPAHWWLTDLS
jgi:uncharacterized protein YcnI